MVDKRRSGRSRDIVQLVLGIVIIILFNFISTYVFERFDLTSEKRFTLSPSSKELVKDLDDVVFVRVYLEGEFPAGFKRLRDKTREMLDEFRAQGKNNIEYEFINPSESTDKEERQRIYQQLIKQGLQPTNLQVKDEAGTSQKIIFPGAIFSYHGREVAVQLLKSRMGASPEEMLNNSVQELEYEISNAIRKLNTERADRVAFIEGHGELGEVHVADIANALSEYYAVERVNPDSLHKLKGFKAAIIAKPDTAIDDKAKFIIDQFVMNGGRVLWLIDRVYANLDSLKTKPSFLALGYNNNVEDLLFRYGVRVNTELVQDVRCADIPAPSGFVGDQPQWALQPWVYFPLAIPSSTHPIVKNLNAVKFEFATSLDTIAVKNVKKTVLLSTSKYSRLQNTPAMISLETLYSPPRQEMFTRSEMPLAVLLEGNFTSIWRNSIPTWAKMNEWQELKKRINYRDSSETTRMIVISDGDVIKNFVLSTGEYMQLGEDYYTGQMYANKKFILNCINYLCDDEGLLSVRSKELKVRLLDKEKVQKERLKWQIINVVAPISLILLFGLIRYWRRKKRYGT